MISVRKRENYKITYFIMTNSTFEEWDISQFPDPYQFGFIDLNKRGAEFSLLREQGLTFREIAKRYGISRQAVQQSYKRFLNRCKKQNGGSI